MFITGGEKLNYLFIYLFLFMAQVQVQVQVLYSHLWQNKSQSVNKITTGTATIGTTPSVQIKRPWDTCIFWNFFEKTNKQNN